MEKLDGFATAWADVEREACMQYTAGELSDALYEQRRECLNRSLASFEQGVALLEGSADEVVARADGIIEAMRPPGDCDYKHSTVVLRVEARDPEERARAQAAIGDADRAQMLRRAGRADEALPIIERLWRDYETYEDPHARAEIARAAALAILEPPEREAAMRACLNDSIRAGHYQLQGFIYADLADEFRGQGRVDEAAAMLDSGLAAVDAFRSYGDTNTGIQDWSLLLEGRMHNLLGMLDLEAGRNEEALAHYRRLLVAVQPLRKTHAPRLVYAHNNIGLALRHLGRPAEALGHYEDAFELVVEAHGPKGHDQVVISANIAATQLDTGQLADAERSLQRAMDALKQPDSGPAIEVHYYRAEVARLRDDFDGAAAAMRTASDLAERLLPSDSPDLHVVRARHAYVEALRGDPQARLGVIDDALEQLRPKIPDPHLYYGNTHALRAETLLRAGRLAEALQAAQTSVEQYERSQTLHGSMAAEALATLGNARWAAERDMDGAAADLERGLSMLKAPQHPLVVRIGCDLADVLLTAGAVDRARAVLERVEAASQDPPVSPVQAARRVALRERLP